MQMTFSIKHCRSGSCQVVTWLCLVLCFQVAVTGAKASGLPNLDLPVMEDTGNRFYQNTKHGWFWYEDPPLDPEEQENKPEKPKPSRKVPSLDNYLIDDLWNMHPDDFQGLLNGLQ